LVVIFRSELLGILSTPPAMRQAASMVAFSITVDISVPPERVWAVMKNVERWYE
jgi:hypothetical protein